MVNVSAYRISVYLLLAVTVHPAGVHSNLGNATDILIWCMGWLIVVKRFERMKIMPDIAKAAGARVVGTGRSDFPNQVNNVLIFPGIFKGALEGRATAITEEMKLAAAAAIAGLVDDSDLNDENILPAAFDPRVADVVSRAVKEHIQ